MFKLHKNADIWCGRLGVGNKNSGPIKTKLDFYYLCLIIGFGASSPLTPKSSEMSDLVANWTEDFREYKDLMIGVLVVNDLHSSNIEIDESNKDIIQRKLNYIIDGNNQLRLTADGISLLNSYAYGGFEKIKEASGDVAFQDQNQFLYWFTSDLIPRYYPDTKVS